MSAFLGDGRANENLHLTSMHLIWARQHNLVAGELSILNPGWDDERLFQETRRILAAQIQHITYNEFLPILLGASVFILVNSVSISNNLFLPCISIADSVNLTNY